MAGVRFTAAVDGVATGTAKKTILQVTPAANHRVKVSEWGISFNGTTNTDAPIEVELVRQTDAGTMTSLTLVKVNEDDGETLQTTAQHTSTSEPTEGSVRKRSYIHPQGGMVWQAPFGQEIILTGSTSDRLALVVTAGVSVSCEAYMVCEE